MPVFNIHIRRDNFSLEQKRKIANVLSLVEVRGLGASECDRFVILNEHGVEELFLHSSVSDVQHDLARSLIIIVSMEGSLSSENRRQLVTSINERVVSEVCIPPDDVFIKILSSQAESVSTSLRIWPWD